MVAIVVMIWFTGPPETGVCCSDGTCCSFSCSNGGISSSAGINTTHAKESMSHVQQPQQVISNKEEMHSETTIEESDAEKIITEVVTFSDGSKKVTKRIQKKNGSA